MPVYEKELLEAINSKLGTTLSPQYAVVSQAAAGNTTVVAGVANQRVYVLQVSLVANAADQLQWQDQAGNLSGAFKLAANGVMTEPFTPVGLFRTASGSSLFLNSSLASQISGHITYVQV